MHILPRQVWPFPGPPSCRKKSGSARNPALIEVFRWVYAGAENVATLGPWRSWPAQPAMGSARDHQGPIPGTVHSCLVSDSNRSSLSKDIERMCRLMLPCHLWGLTFCPFPACPAPPSGLSISCNQVSRGTPLSCQLTVRASGAGFRVQGLGFRV